MSRMRLNDPKRFPHEHSTQRRVCFKCFSVYADWKKSVVGGGLGETLIYVMEYTQKSRCHLLIADSGKAIKCAFSPPLG